MNYTYGNWTVSNKIVDTVTEQKTMSLPDISFATDFALKQDEPSEAIVENITSSELDTWESIRFANQAVKNVYDRSDIPASASLADRKGAQTLVELTETYSATNGVTGEEIRIPCLGRIVLRFPTANMITETLIRDLLYRTIAAALKTGSINADRVIELARGIDVPSGM